ncbi:MULTISPECIES: DUF930 domain-containing protein [Rhizobium]|uniref:Immunoglobulin A1 protease IGA1 protease n=1 Tax=Rhizobium favelukesii TaxID=348824 RepID=W6RDY0_9HYPH|nr:MULTISPECIES: DUF930 domain-containing protein [Rhizobium]MCS0460448.1 DUF930 domain-containing protein [Rhizobium favelukesii]UFS83868.1 DUF930 domain-containing protein [Rhizobium sp. T136]CDM58500.1 Immunoglobulin A1 protease IGA1 protease [Rhizobium favelukesii]
MQQVSAKKWGAFGWGIFASVLLHLAVVAFFLVKLPVPAPHPEEETVSVDLVPPPEEKKPEEKPPELKMPEEPKPEEPKPEEKKAEEKPAETPAEPPKEAKAEQPPPPPPPPPLQEAKAPEEKPPEKPPEAAAAENAQSKEQAGKSQPLSVLRPVVEFGDKDTGPEKSNEGDASVAGVKPDVAPPSAEPKPEPLKDQTKPEETAQAAKAPESEEPPANPVPEDVELPQVDLAENHAEKNGPAAGTASDAKTSFEQGKPPAAAKPDATATAAADKPLELTEAKTLFSQNMTNDPVARTAMGDLPRGARVDQLCGSELRQQLMHGAPSYRPELLPSYRLSKGTVLQVKRGAFRAAGRWYDVSFRCEVDDGATKVKSFGLAVGNPVPRSEWASRRFPMD